MKARHPLAPLTVTETAAATRLALDACPGARLVYCALAERARETVLGWDGGGVPRLARCVLCVDGPANSVYEVDAIGVPSGPGNPYGNAFTYRATLLRLAIVIRDPGRGPVTQRADTAGGHSGQRELTMAAYAPHQ
jgi:hypothetical protein